MNKIKKNEKTKRFKWEQLPKCKNQKEMVLRNGLTISVCLARKGTLKHNYICSHKGIEPQCKYYTPKHKWGRNLWEMAGELI